MVGLTGWDVRLWSTYRVGHRAVVGLTGWDVRLWSTYRVGHRAVVDLQGGTWGCG